MCARVVAKRVILHYYGRVIAAAKPGDIIDSRYEVIRHIGRGAMADVFEASDLKSKQHVAVKILHQSLARDDEALQRFHREARVQQLVSHPNVARLHAQGLTPAKRPYLVMELLRGRSLRHILRKHQAVDVVHAASYCWQSLQGLSAVHQRGILHRDLKPANIMLEPSPGPVERVVLIDFGFAALTGGGRLTAAGHVVGSLSYVAPERLRGDEGDERSDIYAMGVVFYELVIGTPPFVGQTDSEIIESHLHQEPTFPTDTASAIPSTMRSLILRALAKKPTKRIQSAAEMAEELQTAAQQLRAT